MIQCPALNLCPGSSSMNKVRFRVVAKQLWLLGYLDKKPGEEEAGMVQNSRWFQENLKQFQEEAGITIDGWIGNETWKAINALVSFETRTEFKRWKKKNNLYYRAFLRAVQLRLWAYGLADQKPGLNFKAVDPLAMDRFKKILWGLSVIDDYSVNISPQNLFKRLFNARGLVRKAANFSPRQSSIHDTGDTYWDKATRADDHKDVDKAKRRFLVNLAKVELWLLGSPIKIDGKDDYTVEGLGTLRENGFWF